MVNADAPAVHRIPEGAIMERRLVELSARLMATGRTSMAVEVDMFAEDSLTGDRMLGTRGRLVLVASDSHGRPTPVSPLATSSVG